jgi:hypothetical protein
MYRSFTALALALASASAWSQTIGFDLPGGTTTETAGSTFTLDLQGNDWSTSNGLEGGGVDLSYNASVLTLESVTINTSIFDNLGFPIGNCDPANCAAAVPPSTSTGNVLATGIDFFACINPPASGDFQIASFQFVANATGTTNLGLSVDCCEAPFTNAQGMTPDFTFQTASVSVTAAAQAPEIDPASAMSGLALLLGGMAVLRAALVRRARPLVPSR